MRILTARVGDGKLVEASVEDWDLILDLPTGAPVAIGQEWPKNVVFETERGREPGDVVWSGSMELISGRLAKLVREEVSEEVSEEACELLPVKLLAKRNDCGPYYLLKPLLELDVIDRENSEFTIDDGKVGRVSKLVVDEGKSGDHQLFFLDSWQRFVCVGERLAERMVEAGIDGCALQTPEEATSKPKLRRVAKGGNG